MDHFFQNIQGWFGCKNLYKQVVDQACDGDHFVEIGAYRGCSTAYMAVEIEKSHKNIQFDVIDNWGISACSNDGSPYPTRDWERVYLDFKRNINPVKNYVDVYRTISGRAAGCYEKGSLDFVYIDGCHCYNCAKRDIRRYLPKMKPSGIIAGDDFMSSFPGVMMAVKETFKTYRVEGRIWSVQGSGLTNVWAYRQNRQWKSKLFI